MALDTGVFNRLRTFDDYHRAQEEFNLKKQLMNAQVVGAQADLIKAQQVDVDKLGERAFMKAAQGLPLTDQELAAAKFIDAKSGGIQFDPVTGNRIQRPRISDKIGLDGMRPEGVVSVASNGGVAPDNVPVAIKNLPPIAGFGRPMEGEPSPDLINSVMGGLAGDAIPNLQQQRDADYQRELSAAQGNSKLQQSIKEKYATSKFSQTEDQSKAAGFADRMVESNPKIDANTEAATSTWQRVLAAIPVLGNHVVSGDYQSFSQAQRDFINAQLRRESGAAIAPSEFDNAAKQYFPEPGDSPGTIKQKAANRKTAILSMQRSAGPGYRAPTPSIDFSGIPPAAVEHLKANPQLRGAFEEKYGAGSSRAVLGK